jgi:starvation-inducible outer membrane lipoprotein
MKTQLRYFLLALALAAAALLAQPTTAPAQAGGEDPAVLVALEDLAKQQTLLQENQTKMDAQIAVIAEDVRQSRLFAARGGRAK